MPDFLVGLDLGQASDPTALAVLKRSLAVDERGLPLRDHRGELLYRLSCVHLERYVLGTPYPAIVAAVASLMARAPLSQVRPYLAIDATGVGRAVVDLFLNEPMPARLVPVTITAGDTVRRDRWNRSAAIGYWVPKTELVSAVQAGLQSSRLKIVPRLPLADTLRKELADFRVTVTKSAHESFNAREGAHDDLVLSVAMAAWLAGRREAGFIDHQVVDDGRDAQALRAELAVEQAALEAEAEREAAALEAEHRSIANPLWWQDSL